MRNTRTFFILQSNRHGFILAVSDLFKSEPSVLGCKDHHVSKSCCKGCRTRSICKLICHTIELGIVIYLIVHLCSFDRISFRIHYCHSDRSRFWSIMSYHVYLCIYRCFTYDFLWSVISSEYICMHQHSPACRCIEPTEVQDRLRLACTQKIPGTVNPSLYPCMIAVCMGPSRSIDLTCRNTY